MESSWNEEYFHFLKFSVYFKLNILSRTKLQTHGSFELVPKRKTQSDTASKKEMLHMLHMWISTCKTVHKKLKMMLGIWVLKYYKFFKQALILKFIKRGIISLTTNHPGKCSNTLLWRKDSNINYFETLRQKDLKIWDIWRTYTVRGKWRKNTHSESNRQNFKKYLKVWVGLDCTFQKQRGKYFNKIYSLAKCGLVLHSWRRKVIREILCKKTWPDSLSLNWRYLYLSAWGLQKPIQFF